MNKHKFLLSILLLFCATGSTMNASENLYFDSTCQNSSPVSPTLLYLKTGGGTLANGYPQIAAGLGGRCRKDYHGLDISINVQGFLELYRSESLVAPKVQYLFYPFPHHRHALYFGGGVGYGCAYDHDVPRHQGKREYSSIYHFLTVDGVIGCEFRRDEKFNPILQLEISNCVVGPKSRNYHPWDSTLILSLGIGW